MKLRPYQQQACDAIFEQFEKTNSTLAVMPTGTGKTVLFASAIDRMPPGRVMVLAHREELITQAAAKIEAVTGHVPEIEMADQWADRSMFERARVVVSSIQTQCAGKNGGRMRRFNPDHFNLVIIDEAHHAVADSYQKVIDHYQQNPNCKLLGVTATPDRTDEAALGKVFASVAFVYEITDAINDGWLVPIRQQSVEVAGLDFSSVRTTAGDLNGKDLAAIMEYEKNLHEIAHPTIELARGRKTIVFAASVAHAERLCEIFNRHKADCARWVSGNTPKDERRQIVEQYAANRFQFLCNVGCFTEGFDDPGVELVSLARPTKSRALFAQMVGRGTRPLPGVVDPHETAEDRVEAIALSAKPCVEVIDFVGNTGRHKLVTVADILGGNYDDDVVARAAKAAKEKKEGTPADVLEELEKAKAEIRAEQEAARKKEEARRKKLVAKAEYRVRSVDPFDVLGIEPKRERGWDTGRQPSDKMVAMLERNGIENPRSLSYNDAKQLIDKIIKRREHGWCSFKQAKVLKQHGYDPKGIRFKEASQIIDQIFGNTRKAAPAPATSPMVELVGVDQW